MIDVSLNLSVQVDDAVWQSKIPRLQKKIAAAVETALLAQNKVKLKYPAYEITVVLSNNTHVQKLNAQHRKKNYPTNVLSFPIDTAPPAPGFPVMLGDIVLAHDVIALEAKAEKKTFPHHLLHLIVHGTLHLCGYDHETPGQARTMQRLESEVLAGLHIPDPYRL